MDSAGAKTKKNSYLLSRNYILLFINSFVVTAAHMLMITVAARYAVACFSCSDSIAGLAASIFMFGGVVARVLSARYANVLGLRKTAWIGYIIMLVACGSYFFTSQSLVFLLLIRALHGFSFGFATTATQSMVVLIIPKEEMGTGNGIYLLSNSLGCGVGPMLGLFVVNSYNYNIIFTACTIMAMVALASVLLLTCGAKEPQYTRKALGAFTLKTFFDPKVGKFAVYMFLIAVGYSSMNSFLTSWAAELHIAAVAPFAFLLYAIFNIILRPISGTQMDKRGENAVLYPSIICMGIATLLAACAQGPVLLLLAGPFMAAGFGVAMSIGMSVVSRDATPDRLPVMVSTFCILMDAGIGVGPFFMGMIADASGFRVMYLAATLLAVVGFVYYYLEHGRKQKSYK